jgi:D-alanine transaminase
LAPVRGWVEETFAAAALPRAKVYLEITRGAAPRTHSFPTPPPPPTVVIAVRERQELPAANFTVGVGCITRPDVRWGRVDLKTVNLLPNCLAKQEALEQDCFEAIFIGPHGEVREATAANVFAVRSGRIWTHPENERILSGVTRDALVKLLRDEGVEVVERVFTRAEMMAADEVFLTGTTTEVMPVIRIDGLTVADGKPGPVSRRLHARFRAWMSANGM